MALDLRRPGSFDVTRPRQIEVAPGDKILIRANDKRLGLTNGQVLTISNIALDGALQTKEGLRIPADFRQWCHGYVVTSQKGQVLTISSIAPDGTLQTKEGLYVPADFRHGATATWLPRRRPKGGRPITSSLLRNASRQKEPTWRVLEAVDPASYIPGQGAADRKIA